MRGSVLDTRGVPGNVNSERSVQQNNDEMPEDSIHTRTLWGIPLVFKINALSLTLLSANVSKVVVSQL